MQERTSICWTLCANHAPEALARLHRGECLRGEKELFAHGRERDVFELRERRLTVALCSQITSERAVEEASLRGRRSAENTAR